MRTSKKRKKRPRQNFHPSNSTIKSHPHKLKKVKEQSATGTPAIGKTKRAGVKKRPVRKEPARKKTQGLQTSPYEPRKNKESAKGKS